MVRDAKLCELGLVVSFHEKTARVAENIGEELPDSRERCVQSLQRVNGLGGSGPWQRHTEDYSNFARPELPWTKHPAPMSATEATSSSLRRLHLVKAYCSAAGVTRFRQGRKSIYSFLIIALRRNNFNRSGYTFQSPDRSPGIIKQGSDPAESWPYVQRSLIKKVIEI